MEKELVFCNCEFEDAVRKKLLIKDRPVYESDVLKVLELDLSGFYFDVRDCDTLCKFKNLDSLQIDICLKDVSFLASLSKLTELNLEFGLSLFDFKYLSELKCLRELTISGGAWSSMKLVNLEFISDISSLEQLTLHEFGYVDLRPLRKMQQLRSFYCGYAGKVYNYNAIGSLVNLEELTLIDFQMDNIEFLKELPTNMHLLLCGTEFTNEIDISIFDRFVEKDISEITINNERVLFEGDYI